jgi:hypothetical protein
MDIYAEDLVPNNKADAVSIEMAVPTIDEPSYAQ